jgi:parallel beta-helix repeat protein
MQYLVFFTRMKHLRRIYSFFLAVRKLPVQTGFFILIMFTVTFAQAYENEVFYRNGYYRWRVDGVEQGQTSDLATAVNNGIAGGGRDLHITTGGKLHSQIDLAANLNLYCHNNTFEKTHTGYGFYRNGQGPIGIYEMTLNTSSGEGMGIRTSRASDLVFMNIHITGGSIGIRVDSHPSRPYEDGRWCYNLVVQDCTFKNCSSHGLETYSVDGVSVSGIIARNCGECGVLFNKTMNGHVGSVYAYRCCYGGGYAGLRFANSCAYMQVENSTSIECGRGIFILTDSNNIRVKNCYLLNCTDIGIWFQDVADCTVDYGVNNCGTAISGSGSWANTTSNTGSFGIKRIRNQGTSMYLDGMGRTTNGEDAGQYANTDHINAYWALIPVDSYYYVVNQGTGMKLDGYGRTENGSNCAQHSAETQHANAQWEVVAAGNNYYYLVNRGTGMKLDGYGLSAENSSCKQYSNSTTHPNAQWTFQD